MRLLSLRVGAAVALTAALLAGCNRNAAAPPAEPGLNTTISYNGTEPENPLVPGNTVEVGGIKVLNALFKGLVEYDAKTAAPRNAMAQSITTTDSKVYTIKLKSGWTFHDGTPVTAKSYVDAWNFTAYSPNKMAGASYLSHIAGFDQVNTDATAPGTQPQAKELSGLRVLDDQTFQVTLGAAFSTFPVQLGYAAFFPLPAAFFADRAKFEAHPIGNGPFSFVSWTKGKNIKVKRFARYAGDRKVHIGGVEFRYYADLDDAYADVVANKLDYLDIAPWTVLAGGKYKKDLPGRYLAQPYLGYQAIAFPIYNKQWAKVGARQAISMAIDRVGVIKQIFAGKRTPADGLVPPNVQGRATDQCGELCTYQPAKAKALFDKSGFTGPIELASNVDSGNQAWMEATCASIQKALGRPCKFVSTPTLGEFRRKLQEHTMTAMYRSAWVADYPAIEDFLNPLFRTGSASNAGGYTNPAVDKLLTDADSAPTADQSSQLYQQAERQVLQDMPIVPIFFQAATSCWSTRLTGVVPTQFRELDLESVRVRPASSGK